MEMIPIPINVKCSKCGSQLIRSGDDVEAKPDEIVSCPTCGPIGRYDEFVEAVREITRRKVSDAIKKGSSGE